MSMHETHQALAAVLGIDIRSRKVTGFDVRCHIGKPVEVTVHEFILSAGSIKDIAPQHFELRAMSFDLGRMCADALQRVDAFIDRRAAEIQRTLRTH